AWASSFASSSASTPPPATATTPGWATIRASRLMPVATSRGLNSHAPADLTRIAALQVAIAGERPEREELRIAMVAQVEDTPQTAAGIMPLPPEAVGFLIFLQPGDAAGDRGMIDLARRHQPDQRPSGLRGRGGRGLITGVVERIAVAILAPAAVG